MAALSFHLACLVLLQLKMWWQKLIKECGGCKTQKNSYFKPNHVFGVLCKIKMETRTQIRLTKFADHVCVIQIF